MNILAFMAIGAVLSNAAWFGMRSTLSRPRFVRTNYRGRWLCAVGGVPMVTGAMATAAGYLLVRGGGQFGRAGWATVVVAIGFAALGLLDDLLGTTQRRGFRGHLRALTEGTVTTGLVKLVGGVAVAAVAAAVWNGDDSAVGFGRDAVLVALAANVGNLFDRAPGRCIKVAGLGLALAAAVAATPAMLQWPAVVVGAAIGLLIADLGEQLMLGDTGSNVLGGTVGLALVVSGSGAVRWWALMLMIGLNGAAEVVSFSKVIDRVGVLRRLDRAGRRGDPA
ncbi:MAG: UDP-N-acetylmuramyl pentapeptide phosphotransferase/UDP-N-acetylglucosamine-phosphate transferase [Acidimicrobiia bacterium]|nr:UDP-N-acetylmuramyl pentapeptide phosphotransferase/UDP-N-acetylglucosamine-phosphate transferase [Acidimicrobiia bacterium]